MSWVDAAAVIGAVGIAAELVRRYVAAPLAEILQRTRMRDEDWYGEPGRPGVPPRPGVMERVAAIELTTTQTATTLDQHMREVAVKQLAWEVWRAKVDERQAGHDEQIAMWHTIGKIADAMPPQPEPT